MLYNALVWSGSSLDAAGTEQSAWEFGLLVQDGECVIDRIKQRGEGSVMVYVDSRLITKRSDTCSVERRRLEVSSFGILHHVTSLPTNRRVTGAKPSQPYDTGAALTF